ncbi:MAG: CAP domain-containing protein [Bacteroidia bacterium]
MSFFKKQYKFYFIPGVFLFLLLLCFNLQSQTSTGSDSEWNASQLDLGRGFDRLSESEADVLFEINKARTNPKKYAEMYIKPMLEFFNGNLYKGYLETKEGAAAVEDCIKSMNTTVNLQPLIPDEKVIKLARYHTNKQSQTKETGHDTPGGKSFDKRFKKYLKKGFLVGETVSYGEKDARAIVIQLLIDDGVRGRGHRKNILEPKYTHTGIAAGPHLRYEYMCTIDFYGLAKKKKRK